MDDLKARQAEVREQAKAINAGRTPKFGDKMRNPWASEQNPTRDGIFVRQNRVTGTGLRYEMTDGKGKFWESNGDTMMFLDHLTEQPQEPAATVQPDGYMTFDSNGEAFGYSPKSRPIRGLQWEPVYRAAPQPQAAQTEREAEIRKKALDAILWMYRRLKPTTGELQFIEDAIRALSNQPAQADGQKGSEA